MGIDSSLTLELMYTWLKCRYNCYKCAEFNGFLFGACYLTMMLRMISYCEILDSWYWYWWQYEKSKKSKTSSTIINSQNWHPTGEIWGVLWRNDTARYWECTVYSKRKIQLSLNITWSSITLYMCNTISNNTAKTKWKPDETLQLTKYIPYLALMS